MKKKLIIAALVTAMAGYGLWFLYQAIPVISAYGAKNLCSGVFVSGRETEQVIDGELGTTLSRLGNYTIDTSDSSATGSVLGLFRVKAIFRKGLGCTLVREMTEDQLRAQRIPMHAQIGIPSDQDDTTNWPTGNRLPLEKPGNVDTVLLNQIIESAFAEENPEEPKNTRAVVVVYRDTIIAERYAPGYRADMPLCGWSMTKSITNALIGILVKDGKLNINDAAPISEWKTDERKRIHLRHLMQATSGLSWEEEYSGPSDATRMLFKSADAGGFAMHKTVEAAPGLQWKYSSGTTNILSRIVRQSVGDADYYDFPYRRLFHKIGMHSITLEPDASGTFVGSSFSYATARDWARFGLLYLHDGVWQGDRILPEGWVKFTATPAAAAPQGEYGAQWWLNAGRPGNPADRRYPQVPADCMQAEGFEGQYVFVIPSRDVVIVRLGLTQKGDFDANQFVSGVLASIR